MIVLATASAETPLAAGLIERWTTEADRMQAAARRTRTAVYHSLLARAGMRALLFNQTAQRDWDFCTDARGKLSVVDGAGRGGPSICLAHSHGMIACAVGQVPALGVDVEVHRPRDFSAIAAWGFGIRECAAVTAGAAAFYRIWTLREAMGKATGEGLALVTDRIDRVDGGPDEGTWRENIDQQNWLLAYFRQGPDISVAIAAMLRHGVAAEATDVRWMDLDTIASR